MGAPLSTVVAKLFVHPSHSLPFSSPFLLSLSFPICLSSLPSPPPPSSPTLLALLFVYLPFPLLPPPSLFFLLLHLSSSLLSLSITSPTSSKGRTASDPPQTIPPVLPSSPTSPTTSNTSSSALTSGELIVLHSPVA